MPISTSISHERSAIPRSAKPVLITGGAGFIGSNMAQRLLELGHHVVVYDNLSRPGVEQNMRGLTRKYGRKVQLIRGDTRDTGAVREAVANACAVFHFAAQVAVTSSLVDPVSDFEINVRGSLNVLEALRAQKSPPPLLYTSTNKVYGSLDDVPLEESEKRWNPPAEHAASRGVAENRALNFHSPYGCSKGAADQYVLDYARTFGLSAVVFRMSCIYGPKQFGTEDQGWVAHFLIRALQGQPITLFGDGKQVRDLLFVDDLMNAMLGAMSQIERCSGMAFNVGGGPSKTMSLLELIDYIQELTGQSPAIERATARIGDQRYYVSDTQRLQRLSGWRANMGCREGVAALYNWLCAQDSYSGRKPSCIGRAMVTP